MNQPLEFRIAQLEASVEHLNGAYEQIDKRLGDLRSDVVAGFARVDKRFDGLDTRFEVIDRRFQVVDGKFDRLETKMDSWAKALITWQISQTGIILGALAAVVFAFRH